MIRMVEQKVKSPRPRPREGGSSSLEAAATVVHVKTRELAPKEKYSPKPDAPFRAVARLLIGAVHFAVLIGIVALLIAYAMAAMQSSKQMAVVKVVAPDMLTVAAPHDGQFRAIRPFSKGEWVRTGEVLGVVETREVRDKLNTARDRWRDLEREILLGTHAAGISSAATHHPQLRQLRLDTNAVQSEIARLTELQQDLVVKSPIDGRIWFGLSGSKEVHKNDEVTPIWPTGGELRIEIEAPLKYIDQILLDGSVECRFATPQGELVVAARPIPTTRQMLLTENEENRSDKQVFGRIECIPDADSARDLLPGWIGRL
jgi:hypothetical protein